MRQRITATAASLALAVILLVNFRGPAELALGKSQGSSGTGTGTNTAPGTIPGNGTSGTGSGGIGATSGSGGSPGTGQSTTGRSGQFTGPVGADPYGDVQVQITVKNGKIADVTALSLPVGGHSGRISDYVAPILRQQALTAQSARIDGVSGATYTSQAYAQSLQGALDQAGL